MQSTTVMLCFIALSAISPTAAMESSNLRGGSQMADSSPGRRLHPLADCSPIPNSSMELNGAGWSGTVAGGNYHCRLVKSKSWIYDYKVDCLKSGGSGAQFYFNDGGDTYALRMSSNTRHTVSYKGNPRIVAINYCK